MCSRDGRLRETHHTAAVPVMDGRDDGKGVVTGAESDECLCSIKTPRVTLKAAAFHSDEQ